MEKNPEEKVPSLDLCRKLYEFGLTKGVKTERVWFKFDIEGWIVVSSMKALFLSEQMGSIIFPAPDLLEIGELLPVGYYIQKVINSEEVIEYICSNVKSDLVIDVDYEIDKNPCNAVAKMLIKLNEQELNQGG